LEKDLVRQAAHNQFFGRELFCSDSGRTKAQAIDGRACELCSLETYNQEHLLITYQARVNHDIGTAAAVVTTTASFLHSSGYFRRHTASARISFFVLRIRETE